jgi:hypothetical protein
MNLAVIGVDAATTDHGRWAGIVRSRVAAARWIRHRYRSWTGKRHAALSRSFGNALDWPGRQVRRYR